VFVNLKLKIGLLGADGGSQTTTAAANDCYMDQRRVNSEVEQ
jgi:hypothetical protein